LGGYPANQHISIESLLVDHLQKSNDVVDVVDQIGMEANIANDVQRGIVKESYKL
jgi:hypothetical protein